MIGHEEYLFMYLWFTSMPHLALLIGSCLGGVVVSVLVTGPKGCGFGLIFKGNKVCSTPSSQMGSKAGRSHVIRFYSM
jgi:hypothetical protein